MGVMRTSAPEANEREQGRLFIRFCAILFACTMIGALIPYLYGRASDDGRFVEWQKLAQPPEQIVELLAPEYVRSSSGTIYKYSPVVSSQPGPCDVNCWRKAETIPNYDSTMLPLENCGRMPNLEKYTDFVATCQAEGPGGTLTSILARDPSGSLYSWTNGRGEGNAIIMIFGTRFGTVIGLVVGLITATANVRAVRSRGRQAVEEPGA